MLKKLSDKSRPLKVFQQTEDLLFLILVPSVQITSALPKFNGWRNA